MEEQLVFILIPDMLQEVEASEACGVSQCVVTNCVIVTSWLTLCPITVQMFSVLYTHYYQEGSWV